MVVKLDLAKAVKEGCKEEGLVGLIFNTVGVRCEHSLRVAAELTNTNAQSSSDAITMGTDGEITFSY